MSKQWYQTNLRFLQTVLRETDIIGYDAGAVVAYMREVNANTLVVNAGGVIDFFDNPLKMANLNKFMQRDILRDVCDKIHGAGLRVIARVDFRGAEPRRQKMAPDWFSFDQDGNPRTHNLGGAVVTKPCYNSLYIREYAKEFVEYILTNYNFDGIWQNALGFDSGPCYCKNCRDAYRADTENEIPLLPRGRADGGGTDVTAALGSPEFAQYRAWKAACADSHIEGMRALVKKYGDDKAYCAEIFDIYNADFRLLTGIDHLNAKKSFDFIISAVFPDSSRGAAIQPYDDINGAASTIRFSRALDPDKQPVVCTGGNGTRWRYVKTPSLESRLWMWEIAGVGGGIWNCYFNGACPAATHDRRNAYAEKPAYTYLAQNADAISSALPAADVAIYYSAATRDGYYTAGAAGGAAGGAARGAEAEAARFDFGAHIKGIERVLLENHIQYSFIAGDDIGPERLKGVKALLAPNVAFMSDREIAAVKEYVNGGGGLVATYETSLYDEKGARRGGFGLEDVFGARDTGVRRYAANDTYQLITDKNSPLLADAGDADVLVNGGKLLLCRAANPGYNTVSTQIPTIPNQPPEYAWLPDLRTEYPNIITGEYGDGRCVYFANCIDAQCYLDGHEDYTEIYKNAIDFTTGGDYTITADAPRSVHISVISNPGDDRRVVISLVNTTGAALRPIKEVVPVYGISVDYPLRGNVLADAKTLYGDGVSVSCDCVSASDAGGVSVTNAGGVSVSCDDVSVTNVDGVSVSCDGVSVANADSGVSVSEVGGVSETNAGGCARIRVDKLVEFAAVELHICPPAIICGPI